MTRRTYIDRADRIIAQSVSGLRRIGREMKTDWSRAQRLSVAYRAGMFAGAHDVVADDPRGRSRRSPNYDTAAEWNAWREGWLRGSEDAREAKERAIAALNGVEEIRRKTG